MKLAARSRAVGGLEGEAALHQVPRVGVQLESDVSPCVLKNCHPVGGKLGIGDLTPLQCRYDFGHQTLVGTAEGSTVSFKFETFSI